jgi:hypothetical protein
MLQAGPDLCPLTEYKGENWENIEERLEDLFDNLAEHPMIVPHGSYRPGFLTSGAARGECLLVSH